MPVKTTAKKSRMQRICDLASHPRTGHSERNLAVERLAYIAKIGTHADEVPALLDLATSPDSGEGERTAAIARLVVLAQSADKAKAKASPTANTTTHTPFFERWYGKKYDHKLRPVDIAKLVREEIKFSRKIGAASADGVLALSGELADLVADAPASIKFSVRTWHYNSIVITLTGVPQDWGWVWGTDYRTSWEHWMYTPALEALTKQLQAMMNAYRYDGSNAQYDHFDTNFYGRVDVEDRPRETPAR